MPNELARQYFPLLADYDALPIESYHEVWRTLRQLPVFSHRLLTSDELPQAIKVLADQFHLNEESTILVSVAVRKLVFREWELEQCEKEMSDAFQRVDVSNVNRVQEIVAAIKKDVLTVVPRDTEYESDDTEKPVVERLMILDALSKYPQLGQQTVTNTRIKLKASVELVRGSLLNWLKCYREELGVGYHDTVLRGQFIFRSQNGLRLLDTERERIGLILRAIEDREKVDIDVVHQIILFPTSMVTERAPLSSEREDSVFEVTSRFHAMPRVSPVAPSGGLFASQMVKIPERHELLPTSASVYPIGSSHVVEPENQSVNVPSTSGTLQFSSKHVLPNERESLWKHAGQEPTLALNEFSATESSPPFQSSSRFGDSVPTETPAVALPDRASVRPPTAPKRSLDYGYIPRASRIDPAESSSL